MDDYISRTLAVETIKAYGQEASAAGRQTLDPIGDTAGMAYLINVMPSADVEPVRHGRWGRTDDEWNSLTTFQCTVCGEEFCFESDEDLELLNYNYCPNCGSKMDLEVENDEN